MNIYSQKIRWKYLLLLTAIIIGVGSLWYTDQLVDRLAHEEQKKVELWAEATRLIVNGEPEGQSLEFLLKVIQNNETVPVIVADEDDNILQKRNLDSTKVDRPGYLQQKLARMKEDNAPIVIDLGNDEIQYLYYSRSTILTKLTLYPVVQLGVILLFILVAYFAFSLSRKAEQNQVWVGLSKETAHQLGTPISSLMAWVEMLKIKNVESKLIKELDKDVHRLEVITERFSKIGSQPKLKNTNLGQVISSATEYLKLRLSSKIRFETDLPAETVEVPLNPALFEWVLENICKNAMDAIEGEGKITIALTEMSNFVFIDISDTGKGIPKNKLKTIFKPGYTTKERGWGLGLSLTKRIVEEYHNGRIFVTHSEPGKGTNIRIVLNR